MSSQTARHRIAYVSPIFPALSAVFEQNEVLGLQKECEELVLYSCRKVPDWQSELHDFAKPIQGVSRYFRVGQFAAGLFYFVLHNPLQLAKVFLRYLSGAVSQPSRFVPHSACFLLAICFAFDGRHKNFSWVHADFAQGSATVAWHIATLLSLPFSFKAHAFDIYSNDESARERDSFFRAKLKSAKKVFVVHQFGLKLLVEMYGDCGVQEKAVINRVSIRPASALSSGIPRQHHREFTIIALGRLTEKKGFDVLLESLKGMTSDVDWKCEIWGSGEEEVELKAITKAASLSDRVSFMGAYDQEQLPEIMGRASLLVVPSKKARDGDMDGIPTVIFEAMLFRVPVLSTRLSGIPEVVRNGETGWLVDPEDSEEMKKHINLIMRSPSEIAEVVSVAYQYVILEHDNHKLARDLVANMH